MQKEVVRPRRRYRFADGKALELGARTLIMGILNVTPDSFSDGGKWNTIDKALFRMEEMVKEGADIIDLGAESSRPGFTPMGAEEEIDRLLPFLEKVLQESPLPVSVDTFKAKTAETAARAGAHILNDIWGLQYKEEPGEMARVAAKYDLPVVLMHNQEGKEYPAGLVPAMREFFRAGIRIAKAAGLPSEKIILDPGVGFGKRTAENLSAIKHLGELSEIDGASYPILLGTSRKSFIGDTLGLPVEERGEGTGASCVYGITQGAGILRVHDVRQAARMARLTDAIMASA